MTAPIAPPTEAAAKLKNPVGLAALIVGVVAFVFAIIPIVSFIAWLPAIAAIVLGIIGLVQKNRRRSFAWGGLAIGVIAWIVSIVVSLGTVVGASNAVSEAIESASTAPVVPVEEPADTAAPIEEEVVEEPEAAAPEVPQYSTGQANAIEKAESYLALTSFSRTSLIQQLEFEGFSNEDATFAVDTIAPDWNEQAAGKAKDYLELSSFSRQGLIDQLTFEGFSAEEAEFGVAANGY